MKNTIATSLPDIIPIPLPRSKSVVIRCLLINYLKSGTLLPIFENDPNDIKIVYNALKIIDLQKKSRVGEECMIDVRDCGAAYRFLMALLAATKGKWILTGTPRLLQRPILPLVNFLNARGAKIEKTNLGWRIDYHIVTDTLKSRLKSVGILQSVAFSDHCPVVVEL